MLNGAILAEFKKRDKQSICNTFPKTSAQWASQRWIGGNNRYLGNTEFLTKDFTLGGTIRHKQLREYIAASTAVHCLDGWGYLSRSFDAQLCGDHDSARHLAYYSELRAAMSILAAHGVGVFNSEHVSVDSSGKCLRLGYNRRTPDRPSGPGTHTFVWDALSEWAKSDDAADLVLNAVYAGGQPLGEWISHFAAGRALSGRLAKRWLLAWGLDISRLADDRESRNIASYRPTFFTSSRPPKVESTVEFIAHLWRACEPVSGKAFANLDQEILRSSLREAYDSAYHGNPRRGNLTFADRIDGLLQKLQPASRYGQDWKSYLLDDNSCSNGIPRIAIGDDDASSPKHSMQVISRALLLLRIATASSSDLIATVPILNKTNLSSIVDQLGEDRGFWSPGRMPDPLTDLWQDPQESIDAIEGDILNIKSYFDLWNRQSKHASVLVEFERVGLWGVCG